MNIIKAVQVKYLRPCRTIEKIFISNGKRNKTVYVYNFEGLSFRLFENKNQIKQFFHEKFESKFHFECESELDEYLKQLSI